MPSLGGMAPAPESAETRPAWESIDRGCAYLGLGSLVVSGELLAAPEAGAGGGCSSRLPEVDPLAGLHTAQPAPEHVARPSQDPLACALWAAAWKLLELGSPGVKPPHLGATSRSE